MIRIQPSGEPAEFDAKVRKKGNGTLLELIGSPEAPKRPGPIYHGLKTEPDDPEDPLPLKWLLRECPFVARELHRQQRLRPGDTIPDCH